MPPPVHDLAPRTGGARPPAPDGALRMLALDETRRSFLRMVSHELRTPLNSVIGFSEIIADQLYGPVGDPRYADHARLVHESGLRLLKLVNDVLDIARLEAGAMDLDLRSEEPHAALEEAVRVLQGEAKARKVRLLFEAASGVPPVVADHRALQRIFYNLIQNAIAHSPEDAVVTIRSSLRAGQVVFEIADRGTGVAEEDLQRILRPFEQAESALVRRTEGVGLGLAIVGLLCRSMSGEFTVRSQEGEGLTAVVSFPAASAPAAG